MGCVNADYGTYCTPIFAALSPLKISSVIKLSGKIKFDEVYCDLSRDTSRRCMVAIAIYLSYYFFPNFMKCRSINKKTMTAKLIISIGFLIAAIAIAPSKLLR